MTLWHFGNTTVRSALRLRDGLVVIYNEGLEGNIRGREDEIKLRNALGKAGLVKLGSDKTYSVGRKWRSAMSQLGFLIPDLKKQEDIQSVIGKPDYISKNGHILITSTSLQAWQECYLRALSAYRIQKDEKCSFSPFSFVLKVMLGLQEKTGSSRLTKDEMALFVQCSDAESIAEIKINNIIKFRKELEKYKGQCRKKIITDKYQKNANNRQTLNDYADTNFRYLKTTGLFQSSHTSILLDEDKLYIANEISQNFWNPTNLTEYYQALCDGAPLPTDNIKVAKQAAKLFAEKLIERGVSVSVKEINTLLDVASVNAKRHEFEDQLFKIREEAFALDQVHHMDEIIAYIDLLVSNKPSKKFGGEIKIEIPSSERPAYFEWIIWRAFLAINSIVNPPWESRKFKIDSDFKPVSHAAGGSSDLVFEFDDFVLVVEVTLTQSSRQEAVEGEPVRRHVANYMQQFSNQGKDVFALFLAIKIDTNTANTFRLGEWYLPNDSKINVQIVPVTLKTFQTLLEAGKKKPDKILNILKDLLILCRSESQKSAPQWKENISKHFNEKASSLIDLLNKTAI